ncbi:unnamed protein product [Calypogeia fissa]
MAGGIIRRLGGDKVKQYITSPKEVLEVDWSVLSGAGLGLVFKALLADLAGAPPPPEWEAERLQYSKQAWRQTNVEETYFHRNLATSVTKGFLIRGVIYDMPSLIQSRKRIEAVAQGVNGSELTGKKDFKTRDWMSLVDADIRKESQRPKSEYAEGSVKASDVVEKLGLKGVVPGLADRVEGGGGKSNTYKKQNLEALLGKVDGIRAKYADKIRTKKLLADARHEQRELGITDNPALRSTGSKKGWRIVPGSPVLIRYLEKRGLSQGLIARGQQDDLDSFHEQIGNFQFQHTSRELLQGNASSDAKHELSAKILKGICDTWGIPSKEVLLVVGEGRDSEALMKKAGDLGFFICKVKGAEFDEELQMLPAPQNMSIPHCEEKRLVSLDTQRAVRSVKAELQHNRGLRTWFQKLATGTLDVDNQVQVVASECVHFTVADMIELKWVIEDLNGVSYRRSTMIRGFEEMVGRK